MDRLRSGRLHGRGQQGRAYGLHGFPRLAGLRQGWDDTAQAVDVSHVPRQPLHDRELVLDQRPDVRDVQLKVVALEDAGDQAQGVQRLVPIRVWPQSWRNYVAAVDAAQQNPQRRQMDDGPGFLRVDVQKVFAQADVRQTARSRLHAGKARRHRISVGPRLGEERGDIAFEPEAGVQVGRRIDDQQLVAPQPGLVRRIAQTAPQHE